MPHATAPSPGFQALILCGPGASLGTFTSNSKDFPKALIPIANRPMVWYPLDWCYRMGVNNIHLIAPYETAPALEAALSQNPHLTSLPAPKPSILAPESLDLNTSTAEIFRLPEVQGAIRGDFVVLPCDLVSELDGSSLIEAYMVQEGGFGGASGGFDEDGAPIKLGLGGEKSGRRGGLGVWYRTKGEGEIKRMETDFVATVPMPPSVVPNPTGRLRADVRKVVYAMPTDTLKDKMDEGTEKGLQVRHQLLKKCGRVRMNMTHRDAHVYFFPYWVAQMMQINERFDSLAEDVVGWWAKAGWQNGLGDKLKLRDILTGDGSGKPEDLSSSAQIEEEADVAELSTTQTHRKPQQQSTKLATRAQNPELRALELQAPLVIPPILGYIQPPAPSRDTGLEVPQNKAKDPKKKDAQSDSTKDVVPTQALIRRVDTAHLLLTISLYLAKFPAHDSDPGDLLSSGLSPFAHASKVAPSATIAERCTIDRAASLIGDNTTVEQFSSIKESVIGANCTVGEGAKLTRCLLMDGAVVGPYSVLHECILGRRSKIEGGERMHSGDKTNLKNCEVQDGFVVPWGTESKGEKFMVFEGLSDEDMGEDEDDYGDGNGAYEVDEGQLPISER